MRLQNYIFEGRGKPLPVNSKTIDTIKDQCSSAINARSVSGKSIYRGVDENDKIIFIQPSNFTRESLNTHNLYTLFIDNSSKWSKYPKRSKSIICTTTTDTSSSYGTSFVVLPKDGYKIGVCPSGDIWGSFTKSMGGDFSRLDDFNDEVESFVLTFDRSYKIYSELKSSADLFRLAKMIDTAYKNGEADTKNFTYLTTYKGDFMKFLDVMFSPTKNGFKVINNISKLPSGNHEVWTDSDCYLIRLDYWKDNYTKFDVF